MLKARCRSAASTGWLYTLMTDTFGVLGLPDAAAIFETVGGPMVDVELTVDLPFLFVIHDVELGIPLFVGRIADPTAS